MSDRFKQRIVFLSLLVVAVSVGIVVPFALAEAPGPATTFESPIEPPEPWPPVPDVDVGGLTDYVGAVGLGAVITVVIEILKRVKIIPDGQAGRWATIANVVAFAVLVLCGVFGVDYSGDQAKAIFDLLHRIGQAILIIISSPILFKVLREANVLPEMVSRKQ